MAAVNYGDSGSVGEPGPAEGSQILLALLRRWNGFAIGAKPPPLGIADSSLVLAVVRGGCVKKVCNQLRRHTFGLQFGADGSGRRTAGA